MHCPDHCEEVNERHRRFSYLIHEISYSLSNIVADAGVVASPTSEARGEVEDERVRGVLEAIPRGVRLGQI